MVTDFTRMSVYKHPMRSNLVCAGTIFQYDFVNESNVRMFLLLDLLTLKQHSLNVLITWKNHGVAHSLSPVFR